MRRAAQASIQVYYFDCAPTYIYSSIYYAFVNFIYLSTLLGRIPLTKWYNERIMLALEFFSWWYGRGWAVLIRNMGKRLRLTAHMFSAPILLRTLFAPWRRIVSYPGRSLDAKFRAMMDNLVSRFIGFTVRLFVLFAAAVILTIVALIAMIEIIVWPFLPVAVVAGLIKGILL